MKAWTAILVLGLPAAAVLGWVQVALPPSIGIKPIVQPVRIPQVDHSGLLAGIASGKLEKFAPPALSEPTDTSEAVKVEEPIELVFRRSLSAVVGEGSAISLVIVDPEDQAERRSFKVGQAFRDGWKIAAITPQLITLKKGSVIKEIPLFSRSKSPTLEVVPENQDSSAGGRLQVRQP